MESLLRFLSKDMPNTVMERSLMINYNPYTAHEQIVGLILDDGKKIQMSHGQLWVRDA